MDNVKVPAKPGCVTCDNVGERQGYIPISIRYETQRMMYEDNTEHDIPVMVTNWKPTPDELVLLNNGGVIALELFGKQWPPSKLYVDIPAAGRG